MPPPGEKPIGAGCSVGCREGAVARGMSDRMEVLWLMVIKQYLTFCVFAQRHSRRLCLIRPLMRSVAQPSGGLSLFWCFLLSLLCLFSSACFVLYLEVPRWLLSTLFFFIFLTPLFIYRGKLVSILKVKLCMYVCMYVVFPASIKISSWGKKCHTNTKKKTKIGGSRPSEQSRAHVQYGHLASWRFANRPINQWRHHSGDSISTSAIC